MKEKGNPDNVEENLTVDKTEQIEFDFNKLGGKPSEKEIQAKQQRDEFFQKQKENGIPKEKVEELFDNGLSINAEMYLNILYEDEE